ncbi:MAG: hypothetical protein KTR35_23660 [Gammaproteobacteria bacterium]|nr:hypothetical protein [Gammaproteobacteria bacterium]
MGEPKGQHDNVDNKKSKINTSIAWPYRMTQILGWFNDRLVTFWNEPEVTDAPGPRMLDWVMVAVLLLLALAEGIFSDNVIWRPLTTALSISLLMTLPWRRKYPFGIVLLAFGATACVHSASLLLSVDWVGLTTDVIVVILPYALLRWSSGPKAIIGLMVIALSISTAMVHEGHTWLEFFGASLFVLFPAALGAFVRNWKAIQQHDKEQVRMREREQLARELHDTVAHHVSAIAIQAQAGQATAATNSGAAIEALEKIEEAASRTLIEMRLIVRALREDELAERAPGATIKDIKRLALDEGCPLQVNVTLMGELEHLNLMLQSTLYRLAQEAVTNAVRHASGAQNVTVKVVGDSKQVRLTVEDDGKVVEQTKLPGFGLRGMEERVALNGGTLQTGPGISGGWIVEAVLPKQGGES